MRYSGNAGNDVELRFERDWIGNAQKFVERSGPDGFEHLLDVALSVRCVHEPFRPFYRFVGFIEGSGMPFGQIVACMSGET